MLERHLVLDSEQRSDLPGLVVGTGTAGRHSIDLGDIECQLVLVGSIDEPVDPGRVLPIVAEGRVDGINSAHDLDGFFAEDSGEHENFRGKLVRIALLSKRYSPYKPHSPHSRYCRHDSVRWVME